MRIKSFKLKLILSYAFVLLVSFALVGFFLDKNLEKNSLRDIESSLITQARLIESDVPLVDLARGDTFLLERFAGDIRAKTKCRITIISTGGKVIADSEKTEEGVLGMENHKDRPEVKAACAGGVGIDIRRSPTLKIDMLYVAVPITDNGRIRGVLRLALTLENVQKTLSSIRKIVVLGLAFALVLAFILGSILATRIIKPIDKMAEDMKRLEGLRRDLVANVSHELKTPLTSIKGFVETLLDGALDDKENGLKFLKIIQKHTDRLDMLVNDLLVLSSLESKDIALNKEGVDLSRQLDKVIMGFKSQIGKRGIDVKNNLPGGLVLTVDKNRIDQVFTNLIDNAIKFNKENGLINISGHYEDGKVRVIVEDSGIGIPSGDIPRIFERFYRVDKARSRELGGTGLGLSIVKHIIELHGGTVGMESVEGSGSKFWIVLPK